MGEELGMGEAEEGEEEEEGACCGHSGLNSIINNFYIKLFIKSNKLAKASYISIFLNIINSQTMPISYC